MDQVQMDEANAILKKGIEGVPMLTIDGAKMHFNTEIGLLGAKIVMKDGVIIEFGGVPGIKMFAEEENLTQMELNTLLQFEEFKQVYPDLSPKTEAPWRRFR